jgi:hypothetical protein
MNMMIFVSNLVVALLLGLLLVIQEPMMVGRVLA